MKAKVSFLVFILVICFLAPHLIAQPKLWGTLTSGGNTESGIVYEIGLDGNGFQQIYNFPKYNGRRPTEHLLLADNGKFYGLISGGFGTFGCVLFEYDAETNVYIIKHD